MNLAEGNLEKFVLDILINDGILIISLNMALLVAGLISILGSNFIFVNKLCLQQIIIIKLVLGKIAPIMFKIFETAPK